MKLEPVWRASALADDEVISFPGPTENPHLLSTFSEEVQMSLLQSEAQR